MKAQTNLRNSTARFLRDEDGSATVWNMTWLIAFGVMAGLSMDSANAWRQKSMMIATADASSLAGGIELPNPQRLISYSETNYSDVKNAAYVYALSNMSKDLHGEYLRNPGLSDTDADDIYIGHWDSEARKFTEASTITDLSAKPINSVHVRVYRNQDRANSLPMTLLQWASWFDMDAPNGTVHGNDQVMWDIEAASTAYKSVDPCYREGIMSLDELCFTSNNVFYPGPCLHGEDGVNIRNNNTWLKDANGLGTSVSSNGLDNIADSNYPDIGEVQRGPKHVPYINLIPEMAQEILDGPSFLTEPGFVPSLDAGGSFAVVNLTTNTITGNEPPDVGDQTWFDTASDFQVASLGGFGNIAALMGLSHHKAGHSGGGGGDDDTGGGDTPGNSGGGGPTGGSAGCDGGSSGNSMVEPVNSERFQGPAGFDSLYTASNGLLRKNRVYFHDTGGDLTIDGSLDGVVIVTTGGIRVIKDSQLSDVTLISLDDRPNGADSVKIDKSLLGAPDNCAPGGGVIVMAMGSIGGSASAQWSGTTLISGGSIGFAAQSDGAVGFAAFAAGNIKFSAQGSFGADIDDDGVADGTDAHGGCSDGIPNNYYDDAYRTVLVE